MDDVAAARVYIGTPLTDADVALYVDQCKAPPDDAMDDWLDSMLRATFLAAPGNVAKMNQLINGDGQRALTGFSTCCASAPSYIAPVSAAPPVNHLGGVPSTVAAQHTREAPTTMPSLVDHPPPATPFAVPQRLPPAAAQSHGVSGGGANGEATGKAIARQNLPKGLTTVDGVLIAWEDGVDGLLPMRSFVGNKHPTIKLDRAERKQLNDHARIARKVLGGGSVEGIGREQFRVRYEVDSGGKTRTLKAIRVMLEHEARASKSAQS